MSATRGLRPREGLPARYTAIRPTDAKRGGSSRRAVPRPEPKRIWTSVGPEDPGTYTGHESTNPRPDRRGPRGFVFPSVRRPYHWDPWDDRTPPGS